MTLRQPRLHDSNRLPAILLHAADQDIAQMKNLIVVLHRNRDSLQTADSHMTTAISLKTETMMMPPETATVVSH